MEKIFLKIKVMYRFYKWYKNYLKNDRKLTVAFFGYARELDEFKYYNPHLNFVHAEQRSNIVGRDIDTFIIAYGNNVDRDTYNMMLAKTTFSSSNRPPV